MIENYHEPGLLKLHMRSSLFLKILLTLERISYISFDYILEHLSEDLDCHGITRFQSLQSRQFSVGI